MMKIFLFKSFKKCLKNGEIAVMLIGGEFSHSVLKKAKKGDFRVQDDFGGSVEIINPSKILLIWQRQTVRSLKTMPPIYARVDIIFEQW